MPVVLVVVVALLVVAITVLGPQGHGVACSRRRDDGLAVVMMPTATLKGGGVGERRTGWVGSRYPTPKAQAPKPQTLALKNG